MKTLRSLAAVFLLFAFSCKNGDESGPIVEDPSLRINKKVIYNELPIDLVINKPLGNEFDVLMTFHGTVRRDSLIVQAAENVLDRFKEILDTGDLLIISVAYPQENLLFGDNIHHAEAALLWVKEHASRELGIKINKLFLAGHSQGGYIVTRLNTMHPTDGVIANAPGPLNLVFRCQLEENGQIPKEMECNVLRNEYGPTSENPQAYFERSLLSFTDGFKSDILFVQGLNDGPIHMHSWPAFKQKVQSCTNCQKVELLELPGIGHAALFQSPQAKTGFNNFLKSRTE